LQLIGRTETEERFEESQSSPNGEIGCNQEGVDITGTLEGCIKKDICSYSEPRSDMPLEAKARCVGSEIRFAQV